MAMLGGKQAVETHHSNKAPRRTNTITHPPITPPRTQEWHPTHTIFTTSPINPDLDAIPTGSYKITHHLITKDEILPHAQDDRLLNTLPKYTFLQLRSK
jgi:hypothetical protein